MSQSKANMSSKKDIKFLLIHERTKKAKVLNGLEFKLIKIELGSSKSNYAILQNRK